LAILCAARRQQLAADVLGPDEIFTGGRVERIFLVPVGKMYVAGYLSYRPILERFFLESHIRVFTAFMYAEPPTNSFEFAHLRFGANETESHATVTVRRLGDSSSPAAVDYATSDASAVALRDYLPTAGTLNFMPRELVKSFVVPLVTNSIHIQDDIFG
jgi:hypothetical protein